MYMEYGMTETEIHKERQVFFIYALLTAVALTFAAGDALKVKGDTCRAWAECDYGLYCADVSGKAPISTQDSSAEGECRECEDISSSSSCLVLRDRGWCHYLNYIHCQATCRRCTDYQVGDPACEDTDSQDCLHVYDYRMCAVLTDTSKPSKQQCASRCTCVKHRDDGKCSNDSIAEACASTCGRCADFPVTTREAGVGFNEACNKSRRCAESLVCPHSVCTCFSREYNVGNDCHRRIKHNKYCNSSNTCAGTLQCIDLVCKCPDSEYHAGNNNCQTRISYNAQCIRPNSCVGHLQCIDSICKCLPSEYKVGNGCSKRVNYNEFCSTTDACSGNLQCLDSVCKCQRSEHNVGNTCQPLILFNKACSTPNSKCVGHLQCLDSVCKCPRSEHNVGNTCQPLIPFNKACSTPNSKCVGNFQCLDSICKCPRSEHNVGNMCQPLIPFNKACSTPNSKCVGNLQCLDSVCKCARSEHNVGNNCEANNNVAKWLFLIAGPFTIVVSSYACVYFYHNRASWQRSKDLRREPAYMISPSRTPKYIWSDDPNWDAASDDDCQEINRNVRPNIGDNHEIEVSIPEDSVKDIPPTQESVNDALVTQDSEEDHSA